MCDLSSRRDIPTVTFSGLRGRLSRWCSMFLATMLNLKPYPNEHLTSHSPNSMTFLFYLLRLSLIPLEGSGYSSCAVTASLPIQVRPTKPSPKRKDSP
ncbi:hypothetical protein K503DRAFT_490974 [Rhizopogon vinicolor AM-OR11-026]|uniref:Uncharacterized protein n=1 Tax=Rhizopogon vinicolor AM-OR11-026 TaxID=1314800 RepID=A0A1B7MMG5_9AGAM|nr:hypothetical protein K503DRAFT_490974 [Rhizopogon vinicolor AM-OR11-026]